MNYKAIFFFTKVRSAKLYSNSFFSNCEMNQNFCKEKKLSPGNSINGRLHYQNSCLNPLNPQSPTIVHLPICLQNFHLVFQSLQPTNQTSKQATAYTHTPTESKSCFQISPLRKRILGVYFVDRFPTRPTFYSVFFFS